MHLFLLLHQPIVKVDKLRTRFPEFPRRNQGGIGTTIIRTFGMTAASTGLSEKNSQRKRAVFEVVHVSGKDHTSYYPEATDILLKLIFHPDWRDLWCTRCWGKRCG